jgi:hypothetical protein
MFARVHHVTVAQVALAYVLCHPLYASAVVGCTTSAEFAENMAALSLMNRPGMSGDSTSWESWSHVRWFVEEVPAGAA